MTYDQLQMEQKEWSVVNFGTHPEWHPRLGMLEEIGELAHAHLKSAQGIRGTPEEHLAAKVDAVADIVIFLSDYCTCRGWHLAEEVAVARKTPLPDGNYPPWELIEACTRGLNNPRGLIRLLTRYCALEGVDMDAAVFTTWEKVKQRNWKAHREAGAQ